MNGNYEDYKNRHGSTAGVPLLPVVDPAADLHYRVSRLERLVLLMTKAVPGPPADHPQGAEIGSLVQGLRVIHPDV